MFPPTERPGFGAPVSVERRWPGCRDRTGGRSGKAVLCSRDGRRCSRSDRRVGTEPTGTTAARQAVAAFFAAARGMDGQAVARTFAEDALTFDPTTASPVEGHGELQAFFQELWAHFE